MFKIVIKLIYLKFDYELIRVHLDYLVHQENSVCKDRQEFKVSIKDAIFSTHLNTPNWFLPCINIIKACRVIKVIRVYLVLVDQEVLKVIKERWEYLYVTKKNTFFIYIVIKLLFFWIKGYPGINGVPVSFLHRFNWFYVITNRFWS